MHIHNPQKQPLTYLETSGGLPRKETGLMMDSDEANTDTYSQHEIRIFVHRSTSVSTRATGRFPRESANFDHHEPRRRGMLTVWARQ